VEVDESLAGLLRLPDVLQRAAHVTRLRAQNGPCAADHPARVRGVRAQVLLHEGSRLGVSPEVQERPRNLITPQRRVGFRSRLADECEAVCVLTPINLRNADPPWRMDIEGIEGQSGPELGDGFVQEPNVKVNDPQVLMRLSEVRVQRDRPSVLLNCPLMLEARSDIPQDKSPRPM